MQERIITNTITKKKIICKPPINEEIQFDGGVMITETDTKGIITYANKKFLEITGFTKEEIIGAPHNINRHPDMPKGAFKGLWETISKGLIWKGYVKNLRKDGKFYWVLVYIQPKFNQNREIVGYTAGRKIAYRKAVEEMESKYKELYGEEHIDNKFFYNHIFLIDETMQSKNIAKK